MAPRTKRRFHKTPVNQVPRVRPHADRQLTPMNSKSAPLTRCPWPSNDLSIRYHDEEWGTPAHDENILFEFLILEGAQAGLSWDTILKKRENYRAAFDNFDPAVIATYGQEKRLSLLSDIGIVRNRLKIEAAIQ